MDRIDTSATGSFPYERLDGRPLIYASFGTLQPGAAAQFRQIAEACHKLRLQLVLAAGAASAELGSLPGDPVVVPYAPQLELLPKASVVITHAGMNTTMQALSFGKPMLAMPQTHDQPAIAARICRSGAGIVLNSRQLSTRHMEFSLAACLEQKSYSEAAARMERSIRIGGGITRAVELIEAVEIGPYTRHA